MHSHGLGYSIPYLRSSYCATPGAICSDGNPSTNETTALYLAMCDAGGPNPASSSMVLPKPTVAPLGRRQQPAPPPSCPVQKTTQKVILLATCENCLNRYPDYIGHCDVPAHGKCP